MLTKVCIVKAMVFPVVMYRWESWTIKSLSTKELMLQTIVLEKTDAEAPILWPPDAESLFIGKDTDAGKDRGQEEKRVTEDEILNGITDAMDMNLSKLWETVKDREAWHAAVHGDTKSWT